MKYVYLIISSLLFIVINAQAQDYILLPENFILHKGDKLDLHLIKGSQFIKQDEIKYESSKTTKFIIEAGSKKNDLMTVAKDSASPLISYQLTNEGLNTINMIRKSVTDDIELDDFTKILED